MNPNLKHDRRLFLRAATLAAAATRLGISKTAEARPPETKSAANPASKGGTRPSGRSNGSMRASST